MITFSFTDNYLKSLPPEKSAQLASKLAQIVSRPGVMEDRLDRWLSNFRSQEQKELAFKLFLQIDYFDEHRIDQILDDYKTKLSQYLAENDKSLKDIIVVTPDVRADSADLHAYRLSKRWGISSEQFLSHSKLKDSSFSDKYFIFFNDTHGSGNQFVREFGDLIQDLGPEKCFVVCYVISEKAHTRFATQFAEATIIPEVPTPGVYDSILFSEHELSVLESLGKKVYPPHPMGYGGCGLLVTYHYQCPNNNLPIVWANGSNNSVNSSDQGYPWIFLYEYKNKTKAKIDHQPTESDDVALKIKLLNDDFQQCRRDSSSHARRNCFLQILNDLKDFGEANYIVLELTVRVLQQVALEARSSREFRARSKRIEQTFERIFDLPLDEASLYEATTEFGNWAVDFSQRSANTVGVNKITALLNKSVKNIGKQLGPHPPDDGATSEMLVLRARIRRASASLMKRRMGQREKVKLDIGKQRRQALADAEKAYSIVQSASTELELALCLFANSRTLISEDAKKGLTFLKLAYENGSILAGYELVRQLRMRHENAQAAKVFNDVAELENNERRFHSNVHLYSSAMIGIYYDNSGFGSYKDGFFQALEWLEDIIKNDYHTATDVLDFCVLKLICGYPDEEALAELDRLKPNDEMTWNDVIDVARMGVAGDDTAAAALLIGLENPSVWNRIGTLYKDFTNNYRKAVEFYDRAIQLDHRNPIFHVNKASVLAFELQEYEAARLSMRIAQGMKKDWFGWFKVNADKISEIDSAIRGDAQ